MKYMLQSGRFFGYLGCLLLLSFALYTQSHAQLVVNGTNPYNQYVTNLIGSGIQVSNIVITCDTTINPPQMGEFSNGNTTNIGIDQGTLLTSGDISNAVGPNTGGGTTTNVGTPGDPHLDALPGVLGTNDACAIEFDFIPFCDTISISYVFGSEEYPEFVNQFNDPFGFFVTGPGLAPNTNIATVPGTGIAGNDQQCQCQCELPVLCG